MLLDIALNILDMGFMYRSVRRGTVVKDAVRSLTHIAIMITVVGGIAFTVAGFMGLGFS